MSGFYDMVPLNRDILSRNIRVIHGLSRNSKGHISCKIQAIDLRRKRFRALSYAWGPPGSSHSILVNGIPFEVRMNLWNFLDEACTRGITAPRISHGKRILDFLWIDAICIDQSQVKERNHQVAMMGEIYSEARHVLVWLGSSTPAISRLLLNMYSLTADEYSRVWGTDISDHAKDEMQCGLVELCEKEYWERLWVVQEFLLAKNVNVWCGDQSVDLEKIKWLVHVKFKMATLADGCAMELLQGRKMRNTHGEQRLLKHHLDDYGTQMKCADVRDRVYGLLALVSKKERNKLGIRPNYALPPEDLFSELFTALNRAGLYRPDELTEYMTTIRLALRLDPRDEVVQVINQAIEERRK